MTLGDIIDVLGRIEVLGIPALAAVLLALRKQFWAWLKRGLEIEDLHADTLKNSLLINLHNAPHKSEAIDADYDAYKEHGGNSYMDRVIDEWRAARETGELARRHGTWDGTERRGQRPDR